MGDRREFLKIAGLGVLGLAGKPELSAQEGHGTPAEPGKALTANRWAMVIDLNKCREEKGCTDCVSACHKEHNVPHFDNPKDEIKWIWKDEFHSAFHDIAGEHVREDLEHTPTLLLCNHCDNPPCVRVCPTQATWKREEDGIVMMDWHRCIGCRYCVVACPYGSRSFNWRDPRPAIEEINPNFPTRCRGVVEKCTFCEHRLAKGELPACVEACPADALTFGDLEDADGKVRHLLAEHFTIRRRPALGTQPQVYYIV